MDTMIHLQEKNVLDNTYIFYNSDHGMYTYDKIVNYFIHFTVTHQHLGYHLGQFKQQVPSNNY